MLRSASMLWQASQVLQGKGDGSPFWRVVPCDWQFTALAKIFAAEVLPVPLVPQNK